MGVTHWANLNEITASTGIRLVFLVYRVFGRLPVLLILYPVILWFLLFSKTARNSSFDYLNHLYLYSNKTSPKPTYINVFCHLYAFGECILDKLIIWSGHLEDLEYTLDGLNGFKTLIGENSGAVIVVSHIGNLDFCRAIALQYPNLKLTVLVHTAHAVNFNQLLKSINPESALNIVQVSSFSMQDAILFSEKINLGELISIAGDRVPLKGENTIPVNFLGAKASLPVGPYLLARALGCPLLSLSSIKVDGIYQLGVQELSKWNSEEKNDPNGIANSAQAFANILSENCLKSPFQWFNFYPFWQKTNAS